MLIRSILFLAAVTALAQTYEVRGTVTEQGAGGVAEAEVTLLRVEDGAKQITKTDGQGVFRLTVDQPGAYMAGATKPGYTGAGSAPPIAMNTLLRLAPDATQAVANITLVRVGEVSGRVLDEDTRDPIAGIRVSLLARQWNFGRPNLMPAGEASTDDEGRFRVQSVRPGDYIATVRDRTNFQVMDKLYAADLARIDEAYPATYWPGGGDAATAFGVQLTSGGYADVGTIFTHKAPQYRVHVTMQGSCADGDVVGITVLKRNGGLGSPSGSYPCGGELLLRGFDPGSYALYAVSDRRNGNLQTTVSGATSFEVTDKNLDATIALQPNMLIEGQLTLADGVAAPRIVPRITTRPFDLVPGAQTAPESTIFWAPDQRHFQLAVSSRTQSLVVADPIDAYIKEIRYNGTVLRGSTLPVGAGKLEIIVDDKFGSLALTATDGSRAVPASVLILKDLMTLEEARVIGLSTRNTGPEGTLPTTRLAPGDYRIVAFSAAAKFNEPGVIERALSTAQRITVSPGGTQTVNIRVTDAR